MKHFVYYKLVDKENICNLKKEKRKLLNNIDNNARTIIYAPRNFGKTSLVKNVIIPEFRKKNKSSFVFFADLLEVKNMSSLVQRMKNAFEHSFADSFPVKNFLENTKKYVRLFRPEISIDPITSLPNLSLKISHDSKQYSIEFIFKLINDIAAKIPVFIVIDEFQDIVKVDESQALFRNAFESAGNSSIFLMGSKRHILSEIFSNPEAPLAFWGEDVEFSPISYDEYHTYIQERFIGKDLKIDFGETKFIQDILWRIPESINILCHQIYEDYESRNISNNDILSSFKRLIESKESRYEKYIAAFTSAEEQVCIALAKNDIVKKPQGKVFVAQCRLTPKSVAGIINKFMNNGVIEKHDDYYRLSDPILNYFLKVFR